MEHTLTNLYDTAHSLPQRVSMLLAYETLKSWTMSHQPDIDAYDIEVEPFAHGMPVEALGGDRAHSWTRQRLPPPMLSSYSLATP